MRGHFPPSHSKLSLPQQYLLLRRDFPAGAGQARNGRLLWRQTLQPTPVSRDYYLRLRYAVTTFPEVVIEQPRLTDLAGKKPIPHLYKQDPPELCLFRPAREEWSAKRPLSETIIPWSALWLLYFEDWLACGEWHGGGEHPEPAKN